MSRDYYIINGEVYINHEFQKNNVLLSGGKISDISDKFYDISEAEIVDALGMKVVPGFIDIHTHGAVGVDINEATADDLEKISIFAAANGTTSWLSSFLSDTREQTLNFIDAFKKYKTVPQKGANLLGIHLEGPFISSEYKGAIPECALRKSDMKLLKEYQNYADGNIIYITVSPEIDGVICDIPRICAMGIKVAIGHSGADYETAMQAIAGGASSCTHVFNAMKLIHQHYPAILGAVLESDIYCEVICDGKHVHPALVRLLLKTKGTDRVIAVTDSIMAAGLSDGKYNLGVNDIIVENGDAKLASNGIRAGSTLTQNVALKNLLEFTDRPLEDILPLLTENPAKMLGLFDRKGEIAEGKDADIVLLDKNNDVIGVFVGGNKIK